MPGHDGCNMAPIVWVKKRKKRRHFLIMMHQRRQQPQVFLCLSHSIVPPSPRGEQDWRVKKPDHHHPHPLKHAIGANSAGRDESWNSGKLNLSPPSHNPFFSYWPTAKDYCSFLRRMGAARYMVTSAPIIPCKRARLSLQRKLPTLVQIPQVTYMFPRLLCGLVINHQTGKWWALISPLET